MRKLLAKAEDESVTPPEALALTTKAAELMAKYGIDRMLLARTKPETDAPASRLIDVDEPWRQLKANLLCGLGSALRCECILLTGGSGTRVHVFGYGSDIERLEILYASVLLQMWHGLIASQIPERASSELAWQRSWLLGYSAAVTDRVREAEHRAQAEADAGSSGRSEGKGTALVLADRSLVIRRQVDQAYPETQTTRLISIGTGYRAGYGEGQRADIGTRRISGPGGRELESGGA